MSRRRFQYPGEICRPEETIIEEPIHRPFEAVPAISVDLAAVLELEKVVRPMKAPAQPTKGTVPPTVVPVLVQEIKNKLYRNIDFSTAVGVVDYPLGLRDMGIVADAMTVLAVGGGFTYKMNSPANDATTAAVGLQETEFEIEEVYVTGLGAGTGRIRVMWNPDLIRIKP